MSSLTLRHKLPSHVFASHHLRLAFAPLRACSALPCSCLEPSALGVRPALFSSRLQKPTSQVAPHVFASLFRAQWLEPSLTASLSPHASPELRHRLFVGFGRNMPSGTPLMLRSLRHLPPSPLHSQYPYFIRRYSKEIYIQKRERKQHD